MQIQKNKFINRISGQGMTEYIIIVALIAIAAIGAFTYFGKTARNQVAGMAQELSGKSGAAAIGQAGAAAEKAVAQGAEKKGLATFDKGNIE